MASRPSPPKRAVSPSGDKRENATHTPAHAIKTEPAGPHKVQKVGSIGTIQKMDSIGTVQRVELFEAGAKRSAHSPLPSPSPSASPSAYTIQKKDSFPKAIDGKRDIAVSPTHKREVVGGGGGGNSLQRSGGNEFSVKKKESGGLVSAMVQKVERKDSGSTVGGGGGAGKIVFGGAGAGAGAGGGEGPKRLIIYNEEPKISRDRSAPEKLADSNPIRTPLSSSLSSLSSSSSSHSNPPSPRADPPPPRPGRQFQRMKRMGFAGYFDEFFTEGDGEEGDGGGGGEEEGEESRRMWVSAAVQKKGEESEGGPSNFIGVKDSDDVIYMPIPKKVGKERERERDKASGNTSLLTFRMYTNEEEEELRGRGVGEVKAASLKCLLTILTDPQRSTAKFRRITLLTYKTYTDSLTLLKGLVATYNAQLALTTPSASPLSPSPLSPSPVSRPAFKDAFTSPSTSSLFSSTSKDIRSSVISLLIEWLRDYYLPDWETSSDLTTVFLEFLNQLGSSSESHRMLFDEYGFIRSGAIEKKKELQRMESEYPINPNQDDGCFDHFTVDDVTFSLTMYTHYLYCRVEEREYVEWVMGEKSSQDKFQNLARLIDLFNRISMWVTTEIITRLRVADRIVVFSKFVKIAQLMYEQNNFFGLKAILSGITKTPVSRLKKTLSSIPSDVMLTIKKLEKVLNYEKNFKTYRAALEEVAPPCIPFLGVHQKDMFFFNDGNPDVISGLINVYKRTRIADVISDLSFFKINRYRLPVNGRFLTWFRVSAPILTENEMFVWSRRVEPKDPEMAMAEMIQSEAGLQSQITELERELQIARDRIRELEEKYEPKQQIRPTPSAYTANRRNHFKLTIPPSKFNEILNLQSTGLGPSKWTVREVSQWVSNIAGPRIAKCFENANILGADLMDMEEEELSLFIEDAAVCETVYSGILALKLHDS